MCSQSRINPKGLFAVKRDLILEQILRNLALQGGTLGYKKNQPVWPKNQKSTRILPRPGDRFPLLVEASQYTLKTGANKGFSK